MKFLGHIASTCRGSIGGSVYQTPRAPVIQMYAQAYRVPGRSNQTTRLRLAFGRFAPLWCQQTPTVKALWQQWAIAHATVLKLSESNDIGRQAAFQAFMFHRLRLIGLPSTLLQILTPPAIDIGPAQLTWLIPQFVITSSSIRIYYKSRYTFTSQVIRRLSRPCSPIANSPRFQWDISRYEASSIAAGATNNRLFVGLKPNTNYWIDVLGGLDGTTKMPGIPHPIRFKTLL